MKHVFVETNFLIELTRPVPTERLRARQLQERAGRGELKLYVPWCALVEAKRTLGRIIQDDYAFRRGLERYAASKRLQAQVRSLLAQSKEEAIEAEFTREERLNSCCRDAELILPTRQVVEKTLALHPVKSLKPFDEMILGAVLSRAEELKSLGEQDLWFCSLNSADFRPGQDGALEIAYRQAGLTYLENFNVP